MSLRHAILGFLDLEPTSGYLLRKRFEGSVGSFWTATQSQIYRELHDLERDGQVRVTVVPGDGKPASKVYSLTRDGKRALAAWLEEPVGPMQLRDPLLLKLVFAADVPPEKLDRLLADYEAQLEQTRADYLGRRQARHIFALARSARERALWELSIENGLTWCEAQLAWCGRARKKLRRTS